MAIQKPEYELSVWNEELNSNGIKEESKGIIIGAHDMTYLGRATAIKLARSKKGTATLSFQMPTKYFDSEKGEFVKNELIEDLYNERKLKLHHITRDEWYEFYIKKVTENKQYKAIIKQFECTNSFIDELSRTGYEIEFNSELNNSVEELGTFSEEILEDSIWDYRPEYNWGDFTEYREERFYKIPLSQFGGTISAYPIDLKVYDEDLQTVDEVPQIINVKTNEKRDMELGDDLARQHEVFWDNYETDNGRDLLSSDATEISGGYIYVPMSDLEYIMGSVYENAVAAIETPAYYGSYGSAEKYALQPVSRNPKDFIQFIYFKDTDKVLFDEVNTIINMDCHYLISIEDWNKILSKKKPEIFWKGLAATEDENNKRNPAYTYGSDGEYIYTKDITPESNIVDKFTWYPVYADGYLEQIGDQEVTYARKIIISDRTELNLNNDIYSTVYKTKLAGNMLSWLDNDELHTEAWRRAHEQEDQFRIVSKDSTYQILPTLARNLVQNGNNITEVTGWEAKTQNINEEVLGTGSFQKMLELSVKMLNQNGEIIDLSNITGTETDENIYNYFLEFLSPVVDKTDNFSLEGKIFSDYAVNFGLTGQEKKIEKGKIYAIRLKTVIEDGGELITRYNLDLDKVLIGNGSINLQGNYTIEGIDKGDNYISFKDIAEELYYIENMSGSKGQLGTTLYHYKNDDKWVYNNTKPAAGNYVEDNAFILFKANKTIENPYIAIKVESDPLEIKFNGITIYNYTVSDGSGVKINAVVPNDDSIAFNEENLKYFSYLEGVPISLYRIDSRNFSEAFLERIGYDSTTGQIDITSEEVELNDGDFLGQGVYESTKSTITVPLYYGAVCGDDYTTKSSGTAVFVDDVFAGIFWLEKMGGEN